jgi:hypothetical protein
MPGYETVLLFLALLLIGATIVGTVKRGRFRLCRMFLLFLVTVFVTDVLAEFWPDPFYTRDFWLIRESLHNMLRYAVALELAYFAFRSFPGARSTARNLLLVLLVTTLGSVIAASWGLSSLPNFQEIIGQIQLPQLIGVMWLLMGIAGLILWYRLPVDRMHKSILLGWVPFLLIFSGGVKLAEAYDWTPSIIPWVNYVTTGAYFLLLTYWARAAWAPAGAHVRAPAPLPVPASQVG